MVYIVIALAITTVLSTVMITSTDNFSELADNAQDAARARWSAESASRFTAAAIENKVAATEIGGLFKDDWAIANGNASVVITNAQGHAPSVADRTVLVTVTSASGGITSTVQRMMSVQPPLSASDVVDARLREVAIFAGDRLHLENTTVTIWSANQTVTCNGANVAIGFATTGAISSSNSLVNGRFVLGPGAGAALTSWCESQKARGVLELPVELPRATEPAPDVSGVAISDPILEIVGVVTDLISLGQHDTLTVASGAVGELDGGTYVFDDVTMKDGAELVVSGDAQLFVWDSLRIGDASRIRVEPGATLRIWVGGQLHMADGAITTSEITEPYDIGYYKRDTTYTDPSAILIEIASGGEMQLSGYSTLYGSVHAPGATVQIEDSIVVGRITGGSVAMSGSVLQYDPAMDSGYGFTNLKGPLYDDGSPVDGLETIVSNASVMNPDDVGVLLSTLVDEQWDADGTPGATASGYWATETKVVPDFAKDSVWHRDYELQLRAIKERYYAGHVSEDEARTIIANLEYSR